MGRIVSELFTYIKSEDRSQKATKRNTTVGITSVDSLINIEPDYKTGVLRVSKGFVEKIHLGTRNPVRNINITKDGSGNYKFTAIQNGKVFDITNWRSGTIAKTEKHSGLTDTYTHIVPATETGVASYLVLLSGTDYPQKYDFNSVTQLTSNHKANFGVFVNDRLWTDDVDEPARVRWSAAGIPDNFTTVDNSGSLLIGSSLKPLTAMSSMFVPAYQSTNIVLAKEDEMHAVTGNSGDSSDANRFRQYEYSKERVGTSSPRGLQKAGSELFILCKDNIVPFSTLNNQGYIRPQDISKPIRPLLKDRMNPDYLENSFMAFLDEGENGRLYSFVPFVGYDKNNVSFVYDFSGGWFRREYHHYAFTCITKDPQTGQVFAGDVNGNIYEFNTGYNYNGEGYKKVISLGDVDFRLPSSTKTHSARSYIEIEAPTGGVDNIKIEKQDKIGSAVLLDTFEFDIENYKAIYDDSQYDLSVFDDSRTIKKYLDFKGCFDKTKIIISNFDADTNFKINEIYLEADASRGI